MLRPGQASIAPAAFCVGAAALIGQTVLVRELMVSFYGTEPALAGAFGCWLLFVAMGGLSAASLLRAYDRPLLLARFAMVALAVGLEVGFLLARCVRPLVGAGAGQLLSVGAMLAGNGAAALPTAFPVGFFFTAACRLQEGKGTARAGRGIAGVYIGEALGSSLAGALLSFVLLGKVGPGALVVGAGTLVLAGGAVDAWRRREGWGALAWVALALVVCALSAAAGPTLDRATETARWATYSTFSLVESRDTRYQHVEIGERQGEFVLVTDGRSAGQFPDAAYARRRAALLLTQHPDPQDVLVIGGGLGGLCQEMLAAPIRTLHYAEQDPELVDLVLKRLPPSLRDPLGDTRFTVHSQDGRRYLQDGPAARAAYDLIVIATGDPTSAADSRYYTVEFCRLLKTALRPGGVAAFCDITGSENYGGNPAVQAYTACIYRTLRESFAEVVVRPGDEFCFFAGREPGAATSQPAELAARFERLGLQPEALKLGFELVEFPPERTRWATGILDAALPNATVNTDTRPVVFTLFLSVLHHYAPRLSGWRNAADLPDVYARLRQVGGGWFVAPFVLVFVVLAGVRAGAGRRAVAPGACAVSVLTTGMFGLSAEMLTVYGYQVAFGYVYRDIAFLVGLFMVGLAAGGWVSGLGARRRGLGTLMALEVLQGALVLAIPAGLRVLAGSAHAFMAMAAAAGLLTGAAFPIAARVSLSQARDSGTVAGVLSASDHLGAMAGAVCVGLLLVPAVGLSGAASVLALVKGLSLAGLLLAAVGRGPRPSGMAAA